jgi:hypothetical protein
MSTIQWMFEFCESAAVGSLTTYCSPLYDPEPVSLPAESFASQTETSLESGIAIDTDLFNVD